MEIYTNIEQNKKFYLNNHKDGAVIVTASTANGKFRNDLYDGKLPYDYDTVKDKAKNDILNLVEKVLPGIKGHIKVC